MSSKAVRENIYYNLPPSPSSLFCTLHPRGGKEPRSRRVRAAAAVLLKEPQPPSCSRHRQAHLSASAPETPGHPSKGPRGWGLQHHSLRLLGLHLCPNPLSFPRPVLSSRLTGWLHPRPPKVREGSPGTIHELRYQVSL